MILRGNLISFKASRPLTYGGFLNLRPVPATLKETQSLRNDGCLTPAKISSVAMPQKMASISSAPHTVDAERFR